MYVYKSCEVCCVSLSPDYNVNFFKQFSLVMNALDNKGTMYIWPVCTLVISWLIYWGKWSMPT